MYHRNIFGSSLKLFGNLRKFLGNVRERPFGIWKSLESGWKSSENHRKHGHQYVYILKRTLHVTCSWEIHVWILCSHGKNNISLVCRAHSWDTLFLPLEHKINIFLPLCNILYVYLDSNLGPKDIWSPLIFWTLTPNIWLHHGGRIVFLYALKILIYAVHLLWMMALLSTKFQQFSCSI